MYAGGGWPSGFCLGLMSGERMTRGVTSVRGFMSTGLCLICLLAVFVKLSSLHTCLVSHKA